MAAYALGRRFILVDNNPQALEVMAQRFASIMGVEWMGFDPGPYQKGTSPSQNTISLREGSQSA
jgi:site-specific DNA-methyltransferase (adenine-specific)